MYKRICIISILVIISTFIIIIYQNNNKSDFEYTPKNIKENIKENINYFNNNVLTNIDQFDNYFSDRYVIINSGGLRIGKSKNELDNGYYDVDLRVKEKYIELYINKLFKEFDINVICNEAYVKEITEYIIKLFNFKIDEKAFSQVIITNYELIRDIDRNNVQNVDKTILINDINIVITVYENMLVLKMGDI
ncbi:MAG: hypothetical protein PHD15_05500 [Clostridia bacterium]|nr:hypothetical protein [Clostridia bacterium]MDD4387188.1 hypothetical protein [Clostridia bacterium]